MTNATEIDLFDLLASPLTAEESTLIAAAAEDDERYNAAALARYTAEKARLKAAPRLAPAWNKYF